MPKVPYLCGGTLFFFISTYKVEGKSAREHLKQKTNVSANSALMDGLVEAVAGDSQFATSPDVSKYMTCRKNSGSGIPFDKAEVSEEYDKQIKNNYEEVRQRMYTFVKKFMKGGRSREHFVTAVLDIMAQDHDDDFNDDTMLYVNPDGSPARKIDVLKCDRFDLPAFLVGMMHFILRKRREKNKNGAETIKKYAVKNSRGHWVYAGGVKLDREIHVGLDKDSTEELKKAPQNETAEPSEDGGDAEFVEAEVVDDFRRDSDKAGNVYIEKQVNIGHNETNNFDIKDSTVTFNL